MVELAKERAGATGDSVVLHRPFDIDHEDDPSCICRPLIIKSDSIEDPEGLYTELNRADG